MTAALVQLQANMALLPGRPASVFAAWQPAAGILVVAAVTDDIQPRRDGCVLIATEPRGEHDARFGYADLTTALPAYFALKGRMAEHGACLTFRDRALKADPASAVELDGVEVHGPVYRLSPAASNAQLGALALCWYAQKWGAMADTVVMADDLKRLLWGAVVTI